MEVRGCSHVHFISVMRDGEVMKLHNIAKGESALKFKNIEQIYGFDGQASLAKHPPNAIRLLAAPSSTHEIKTGYTEDEDNHDFGSVTLNQLKQTCKSKKRKSREPVSVASVKQENIDFYCEEDDQELKETLFSLKRKLFKKAKSKKRSLSKHVSSDFETENASGSSQNSQCSLAFSDISNEICLPLKIKVEDAEAEYLEPIAACYTFSDDSLSSASETEYSEPIAACYTFSDDSLSLASETEAVHHTSTDSAIAEALGNPLSGQYSNKHELDIASLGTPNCSLNQVSEEFQEHVGSENRFILVGSEHGEFINVNDSTATDNEHPVSYNSYLQRVEAMTDMICYEASESDICEYGSVSFDSQGECLEDYVTEDTHSKVSSTELQAPSIGTASETQNEELADKPSVENFYTPCTSVTDEAQNDEDELMSHGAQCSPNFQFDAEVLNSLAASERNESKIMPESSGRIFSARKAISPDAQERLQKAMRSNSIEDEAMICSYKEKILFEKDEAKSSFASSDFKRPQTILTSQSHEIMQAVGRSNGRHMVSKGKGERSVRYPKCTPNGTGGSQLAGSPCSTIQSCSKNAIAFSQQQMSDFERLTKKLVVELQSMKAIIVDGMHSESRLGTKFRYNTDEVKMAVENAAKVEESTRKMLGIMTKDCNRFCKIMRLAEANAPPLQKEIPGESKDQKLAEPDSPSPGKKVHKERKIIFADEAGGNLCNVRYFEDFETHLCASDPANTKITEGYP